MSMQYIRDRYEVPAFRGVVIRFCRRWSELECKVTSAKHGHLVVAERLSDGSWGSARMRLHPTWNVQYPMSAWVRIGVQRCSLNSYDD